MRFRSLLFVIILAACAALGGLLPATAAAQGPVWSGFGGNAQHTGISTVASQAMDGTRWSTPVDLDPQYGNNYVLYAHYGSPMCTAANTVIVPVKTGATDGFQVSAFNGTNGALLWTQSTDYSAPYSSWTSSYGATITPQNCLYYDGGGGTVYYRGNLDSPGAVTPTQLAFYGLGDYQADPSAFSNVQIATPMTSDSSGDIYFGFTVTGTNSAGLSSGIARISASGQGTWISASAAADGESYINNVQFNSAPALSADGKTLYAALNGGGDAYSAGCLVALDATTLQPKGLANLNSPVPNDSAFATSISTASPTVAPDGRVLFGVLTSDYQGYMLQFSPDLSTSYAPGFFGWDATSSIVPASMVKSYTGSSSYLVMTKDNNYSTGQNQLVLLDPNATQLYTDPNGGTANVMKVVLSVLGPTPDPSNGPGAVYEWCLNSAAVDPATDSIIANSEDGSIYRWNLSTDTLTQSVSNCAPIGAAYTPTIIGADGTSYSINNGVLYATTAFQWTSLGSGVWSSSSSWFGPLPDGPGATASFLNSTTGAATVTLDGSRTVGALNFDNPYGYFLVATSGSTLTLSQTGGASASITVTNVRGNGSDTIAQPLVLASPLIIVQNSAGTLTISGPISENGGSFALSTAGTGTVVLSGTNSYSGGTAIDGGILVVAASANLGLGPLSIGPATLEVAGSFSDSRNIYLTDATATVEVDPLYLYDLSGAVSGIGGLTKTGPGELILSGSNSYSGGTFVNAGTLEIASVGGLSDGSELSVGADASLLFGGSLQAAPVPSEVQTVPEPGMMVLLTTAVFGSAIYRAIRSRWSCGIRSSTSRGKECVKPHFTWPDRLIRLGPWRVAPYRSDAVLLPNDGVEFAGKFVKAGDDYVIEDGRVAEVRRITPDEAKKMLLDFLAKGDGSRPEPLVVSTRARVEQSVPSIKDNAIFVGPWAVEPVTQDVQLTTNVLVFHYLFAKEADNYAMHLDGVLGVRGPRQPPK